MLTGDYIEGLFYCFEPFSVTYALVKGAVFAFIITSISAYCGYYAKGNSL
jgi:phospholipid/cholesterol/gamma-HCH transport system permease protein